LGRGGEGGQDGQALPRGGGDGQWAGSEERAGRGGSGARQSQEERQETVRKGCAAKNVESEAETELYTVLYTNAQSVVNKIHELCVVAHEEKPDFILICESFCNIQHIDAFLRVPGYQLAVRQDGTYQGRARGLLIYAKEELKTVRLNLDNLDLFDEGAGISVPWW
jgi:hypothetical protein